jgi:serpin B
MTYADQKADALQNIVERNTHFAFDLYKSQKKDGENTLFSPFSISTAFAALYAGTRGNTAQQFADALSFPQDQTRLHDTFLGLLSKVDTGTSKGDAVLRTANGLWIQSDQDLRTDFVSVAMNYYQTSVKKVDFRSQPTQVLNQINTWVAQQTNNKITQLLPPGSVEALTKLVLANAVYFKSQWANQFDVKATALADFWVTEKKSVQVQMMRQRGQFGYAENELAHILVLPYKGEKVSFVVLFPKSRQDLAALEQSLDVQSLKKWLQDVRTVDVLVHMPRFRITTKIDLVSALASLGMTDPFSDKADFSGINGTKDLYISSASHQALLEVDEKGSEAAAATGISIGVRSLKPIPEVRLDRPFLFLIRENASNTILFLGRLIHPLS